MARERIRGSAPVQGRWVAGGVTAARGYLAAGVSAGIKRGRKLDLALVVTETPATAVGVFTTNRVRAAPVELSEGRLRSGAGRAVLLNSGCANCLTGPGGLRDAAQLCRWVARELKVAEGYVVMASTGLIGPRLPVAKIRRAIPLLVRSLDRNRHRQAARAMLTTDTVPKEVAVAGRIAGRMCHLGGMAKGAGMIAPRMATMLSVLTTDVAIDQQLLAGLLRGAVESSFNRISVDGEMSTNDSVFMLANGRSGVTVRSGTPEAEELERLLWLVTQRLARLLVQDGEGATTVASIEVQGARSAGEARACARQVASSLLVKTMLAGRDPNVGRIAAAVGASGARFDPGKLEIRIEGLGAVVTRGTLQPFDAAAARKRLQSGPAALPGIQIRLHAGSAQDSMLTCDLTEEYVRINARYAT